MTGTYFAAEEPILLRAASIPRGALPISTPRSTHRSETSDSELVAYIRGLASNATLKEAITVSSTSLGETLDSLLRGDVLSRKKLVRTAISVTKYALRITGRPTPFGLQAGVSVATLADRASIRFSQNKKHVSYDEGWFSEVAKSLLGIAEVRSRLTIVANDLCHLRGNRIVIPYAGRHSTENEHQKGQVSIRLTRLLSFVRTITESPIPYEEAIGRLADSFPKVTRDQLDGYMLELIRSDVILTSLVSGDMDDIPEDTQNATLIALREVSEGLRQYEQRAVGEGLEDYKRTLTLAKAATGGLDDAPLQVDLTTGIEATLPRSVLREIETYASAVWRIAPNTSSHPHMVTYFNAFADKYGKYGAERLDRLIDSHVGLGFPQGFQNPPVESRMLREHDHSLGSESKPSERAEILGTLLHRGLASKDGEIVLSDVDIDMLARGAKSTAPPSSMDLCFQLMARSLDEMNAGDFRLAASPLVGSRVIGATMGRFARLTGSVKAVSDLYARPATDMQHVIYAQVDFQPNKARALNVMRAPRLSPYVIPVGTFSDRSDGHIDWRELVVYSDGQALRLHWERKGVDVQPFVPHMLALQNRAPNLARFLSELRYSDGTKAWKPWSWTGHESMPALPRVRLGRVIAFPKTWRPSAEMRNSARDAASWTRAVQDWRERTDIQNNVSVSHLDRVYGVDLNNEFHREMLRRDVLKGGVEITETLGEEDHDFGWLQDRSNEIVVPLRSTPDPMTSRKARPVPRVFENPRYEPAGEWAYIRVFGDLNSQNDFISQHLPDVVREVAEWTDRWFFIRFNSPDPHIRLRFHAATDEVREVLLVKLLAAAKRLRASGVVRKVTVDNYEPEVARYGGPTATTLAEKLFCIDSQTAINQIRLLEANRIQNVGTGTLMVANYACLLDSLGLDWCTWVGKQFPRSHDGSVSRTEIDEACAIISPSNTASNLGEHLGSSNLGRAWSGNVIAKEYGDVILRNSEFLSETARDYSILSLLHMQHNRLIGINPENEKKTLTLLGHVGRKLSSLPR
ncbi:lantibiotic dehydratase [Streptomyces sp. NPDC024089]|uniref:lantibiotic dehydratase n=1 Tax=Streptomyces sp. NPDC024089 TaxID=3154328 RepID=UPI00340CE075